MRQNKTKINRKKRDRPTKEKGESFFFCHKTAQTAQHISGEISNASCLSFEFEKKNDDGILEVVREKKQTNSRRQSQIGDFEKAKQEKRSNEKNLADFNEDTNEQDFNNSNITITSDDIITSILIQEKKIKKTEELK